MFLLVALVSAASSGVGTCSAAEAFSGNDSALCSAAPAEEQWYGSIKQPVQKIHDNFELNGVSLLSIGAKHVDAKKITRSGQAATLGRVARVTSTYSSSRMNRLLLGGVAFCIVSLIAWDSYQKPDRVFGFEFDRQSSHTRMAWLDNAKFFALCLVVLEHEFGITKAVAPGTLDEGSCQFIKMHTRMLCFISGIVSHRWPSQKAFHSLVLRVAAPLILSVAVLGPLAWLVHQHAIRASSSLPSYSRLIWHDLYYPDALSSGMHHWYLESLICWQLCALMLCAFRPYTKLALAIVAMSVSWFLPPWQMGVENALSFLPIYIAGQLFPAKRTLELVPQLSARSCFAGFVLMLAILRLEQRFAEFVVQVPEQGNGGVYFGHYCPNVFTLWDTVGGEEMARCFFLAMFRNILELTKSCIFLVLCCPRSKCLCSDFGMYAIYPYMLHQLALDLFGYRLLSQLSQSVATLPALPAKCTLYAAHFAMAIALNVGLATWPVRSVCWPLFEPTWIDEVTNFVRKHR